LKEQSEKQMADARVSHVQEVRRHSFVFANLGPAAAHDVRFEFVVPEGQHNPVIERELSGTFPIDMLRVGKKVSMLVAVNLDTKFPLMGKVSWRSADGEMQEAPCPMTLRGPTRQSSGLFAKSRARPVISAVWRRKIRQNSFASQVSHEYRLPL
jgi:hypothetical protein